MIEIIATVLGCAVIGAIPAIIALIVLDPDDPGAMFPVLVLGIVVWLASTGGLVWWVM